MQFQTLAKVLAEESRETGVPSRPTRRGSACATVGRPGEQLLGRAGQVKVGAPNITTLAGPAWLPGWISG